MVISFVDINVKFEEEVEVLTERSTTMGIEELLLDRAEKKGLEKGLEKGRHQESVEIAKRMKDNKMPVQLIASITGLPEKEIAQL